jgi:hypothetical protein
MGKERTMSGMSDGGPEQVIRDFLTTGNKRSHTRSVPGAAGPRAERGRVGCDARPDSIRLGKMRQTASRQLYAVTFENTAGQRMRFFCCVRRDDANSWRFDGGAGGSADGAPHRSHAWVNLGGGGWPKRFYAAGQVLDDGGAVTHVRLHTANGALLEDTVGDDGVVLFLSDDDTRVPLDVELLDRAGQLVARHPAMAG